jgi:hypothetical protein
VLPNTTKQQIASIDHPALEKRTAQAKDAGLRASFKIRTIRDGSILPHQTAMQRELVKTDKNLNELRNRVQAMQTANLRV